MCFKIKSRLVAALAVALFLIVFASGCRKDTSAGWSIGEPMAKENVKISIIYVDGSGVGYSLAHEQGLAEAQRLIGLSDEQVTPCFNVNDAEDGKVEHVMRGEIANGSNIIIATSWGHMEACAKLAEEFPNVIFAHASGFKSNDTNFTNYFGRIYQARYLSGIAAGLNTQTGKIGYVAAHGKTNSEVTGGLNAFAMGVESVNPEAEVYVAVTHSWYDPAGERVAAQRLLVSGCDVIAQHSDTYEPQRAAKEAGALGIGYNTDMSLNVSDTVLTSAVWYWDVFYTSFIQSIIDGNLSTAPYYGGLEDGLVGLAPIKNSLAAPETEEAVNAAKNRILNEGFKIFGGEMETNDGRVIGTAGSTLSDAEIALEIDWYYRNISEISPRTPPAADRTLLS
ncbi:MAG: BMP family ABC transporter substrate-binding protein [Oscillospiraceae bacterium]|nr:BMP family ABC transporter substrate-binding protein [Oscillospiraceae bacterium]